MSLQLKKDSDEMKVAERQNVSSLDEDENSDDDADMDIDVKTISASLHKKVTVVDNEEVSGSSKKFAVQESDLPEVYYIRPVPFVCV